MNTRILALIAALPLVAQAGSPLIRLNEDGSSNIQFTGEASASYNDNIFYQNNKSSDTIFTVAPGLELNVGGDGNSKFKVTAKETFSSYSDHSDVNTQLGSIDALYTYDAQSAFKARVGAGLAQKAQPTTQTAPVAGTIVRTLETNAFAIGEYKMTEKSSVETGVKYNGTRYTNGWDRSFNDQDSYSIPVSWFYAITDKLDAGFTYQYTFTDLTKTAGGGLEPGQQDIHFFGLTTRGQVTEKLKVEANAGIGMLSVSDRAFGGNDDTTTFNFGLAATYAVTEKLTTFISGNRNFSAGANAQAVTTTAGNVGVNYAIDQAWTATAYTGYMVQDFDLGNRKDDIFTAGASVTYAINKYWKTTLSYSYMNDSTNLAGGDFDNNIIAISASVKY